MAATATPEAPPLIRIPRFMKRPRSTDGLGGWLTTIDHKRIGILYGVTAFIFFIVGGCEALLIRLQRRS